MLATAMLWVGIGYPLISISSWSPDARAAEISDSVTSFPSTCASVNDGGSVVWSAHDNALTSNDARATAALGSGVLSHDLRCSGFNLGEIPQNATIKGITAYVERMSSVSQNRLKDSSVRVMKAGVKTGSDMSTGAQIPSTETATAYGGATSLWGVSWSVADVTNAGFGVSYRAAGSHNSAPTVSVDAISVKIDYTYPNQTFTQGSYRLYDSSDASVPGAVKGAINQPVSVSASTEDVLRFESISAGQSHTCAIDYDYEAYCWGGNSSGQLGDGTRDDRLSPTRVDTTLRFRLISAGTSHTCAISYDYDAYCWGGNFYGQLGVGSKTDQVTPVKVNDAQKYSIISAGGSFTCAVQRINGSVFCWGNNSFGQLGTGDQLERLNPTMVAVSLDSISSGGDHVCGDFFVDQYITENYCWGSNVYGQVGIFGSVPPMYQAIPAQPPVIWNGHYQNTVAGLRHSCAVQIHESLGYSLGVKCWGGEAIGYESGGELSITNSQGFWKLSAGEFHTCAIKSGSLFCWGLNYEGQLGDETFNSSFQPVQVSDINTVQLFSAGGKHTCALLSGGTAYCWGDNSSGQLGDNTKLNRPSPVRVGFTPEDDVLSNSFRVRMSVTANGGSIDTVGSKEFRLDYALRTAATCSDQSTGFKAVTTSTPVAWHTSLNPPHAITVAPDLQSDPTTSNVTYQKVLKDSSEFTNRTVVAANQSMLWDFALKVTDVEPGASYCLKIVDSDGTPLSAGYQHIPEITVVAAKEYPSISFVSSAGQSVAEPNFQMSLANMMPSCQSVSTTLGSVAGARLRLTQGGLQTDGFSVTIAPRDGQSALWTDAVSSNYYDFNDGAGSPGGCSNGSDGDMYAGQLTIDRSSSVLSPSVGCDLTGLSYVFGPAAFESGSTDTITLVSGSSSVSTNCKWDLTDTIISQTIPPNQPAGDYSIDLTITVVAS